MSFLDINGLAVPIQHQQATRNPAEFGGASSRSFDGTMRKHSRSVKESWSFTTKLMPEQQAVELEGLLMGLGHHMLFNDDFYSAQKGLGPATGYTATLAGAAMGAWSDRSLSIATNGTAYTITWDAELDDDYTVMVWNKNGGSGWEHWGLVYDKDTTTTVKYEDGADGGSFTKLSVSSGVVTLTGDASNIQLFDDLVILPYKINDTSLLDWHYNSGTGRAFSDLPRLSASGDYVKSTSPIITVASVTGAAHDQGVTGGSFVSTLRSVSFDLVRV